MPACIMCNAKAVLNRQKNTARTIFNCPNCGVYIVSDFVADDAKAHACEIAPFLVSRRLSGRDDETILISDGSFDRNYINMTIDEITAQFPGSFTQTISMILRNLELRSSYYGEEIRIEGLEQSPLFYVRKQSYEALSFMIKTMQQHGLIEVNYYSGSFFPCGVIISAKGWGQLYAMQRSIPDSPSALFVSAAGRETASVVRKAVQASGLELLESGAPGSTDQIGLELLCRLRRSRLLICDLSDSAPESYYAMGMAHALQKPMVLLCHSSQIQKIKIDTNDFHVYIWKDESDLKQMLLKIIRSMDLSGTGSVSS